MKLREYQSGAIDKLRSCMAGGKKRIVLQASCGAGKTIISAEIVSKAIEKGKKVLFLVNRRDLIKQTVDKYTEYGLGDEIGIIMAGEEPSLDKPIQCASLQTYTRRLKLQELTWNVWFHNADLIVYDECFVAGTMVDGRPIETLRVGDYVKTFNEKTGIVEEKRIFRLFKSPPRTLCRVKLDNGNSVVCTESHPFYVDGKYLTAIQLKRNDMVHCVEQVQQHKTEVKNGIYWLLQCLRQRCWGKEKQSESQVGLYAVQGRKEGIKAQKSCWGMYSLQEKGRMFWEGTIQDIAKRLSTWVCDLFGGLCKTKKKRGWTKFWSKDCEDKRSICLRENEDKKSDVGQGCRSKDDDRKVYKQNIACCSGKPWRQWETASCPTINVGACDWVGNGGAGWDKNVEKKRVARYCESLQDRYRKFGFKDRNRSGWIISQWEKTNTRHKERIGTFGVRVDSIEVFKQTSDGRFGGMCQDGFVYNIEVDGNNNYFVNGILVHNCHSSNAPTYKAILEHYKDKYIIGLSATPLGASGTGLGTTFQEIVQCVPTAELISQGFLVPPVHYAPSKPDLTGVGVVAGDYNKKQLGERVNKPRLVGDIYENWARLASDRSTIIFATNVKHSVAIKQEFEKYGVSIAHIDAHTCDEEREDIYRGFENGDIQVLTNVGVCCEGSDLPIASAVVIAKPTLQIGRWIQMGGRGARPYPGKENFLILDHAGCIERHGFIDDEVEWSLDAKKPAAKKKVVRKKEKTLLTCEECSFVFSGKRCPQCGLDVPDWGKKIEAAEAELVEIGKVKQRPPTMEEKRKFYGMLEWWRRDKGYREGWVAHKYRSKYNCWPRGMKDVRPEYPDAGFFNWIKYLNIKSAKRREADRKLKAGMENDMFNYSEKRGCL